MYGGEQFHLLMMDIRELPETQRSALLMREMGGLSYEQIAEAMEKTRSSVKSLLVRARVSLTEAAGARSISCDDVTTSSPKLREDPAGARARSFTDTCGRAAGALCRRPRARGPHDGDGSDVVAISPTRPPTIQLVGALRNDQNVPRPQTAPRSMVSADQGSNAAGPCNRERRPAGVDRSTRS